MDCPRWDLGFGAWDLGFITCFMNNTGLSYYTLIFLILYITMPVNLYGQTEKEKLQQKKKNIESEISNTNNLLNETRKATTTNINQLTLLERQMSNQKSLINIINSEIRDINNEIEKLNTEISNLKNEMEQIKSEYAQMIYYSYLTLNSYQRLMFIIVAKNMNEAFLRVRYLNEYANSRKRHAQLIVNKQKEIEEKINSLEKIRKTKFMLLREQEGEIKKLNAQKTEKNQIITDLKQQERKLMAELRQKQKEADNLQRKIEELIRKEIEEARKRAEAEKKEGVEYAMTAAEFKLSKDFVENKGKLPWPVDNGVVSARFGENPHPVLPGIKIRNNGIDISARRNTQVKAIFDGNVSAIFNMPNQIQAVIVRHGEYLTVYANLATVNIKKGAQVSRGDVIGVVHTNSNDNSTMLHFELWRETTQENPEIWLRRIY